MTEKKTKDKKCQNCEVKFRIEPEDFEFYKKIDVPEPTFCPECRLQRRLTFRNFHNLYKDKCDFSGKEIISIYNPESKFKVYDHKIWNSDKWDPMEYGRNYDFGRPFFEQLRELSLAVPRPNTYQINSVNSEYCALANNAKNCYLTSCNSCEDCYYFIYGYQSKNCFDCYFLLKSELCYETLYSPDSYGLSFSHYADNCFNSAFLYNCKNCQDCFGCVNLKHKKYHIFNKPYSKSEYEKKVKEYDLGSHEIVQKIKKKFLEFKKSFPRRYAWIMKSENTTGDNVGNAKNCHNCFSSDYNVENCKYMYMSGINLKDSYDVCDSGTNSELLYEVDKAGGKESGNKIGVSRVFFSEMIIGNCQNIRYSMECGSSQDLFGCIGLRHKKYCILNKQYSKQEYEKILPKIIKHMSDMPFADKKGNIYRYGEFFPPELSYFAYNEAIANEFYPLTKKQALLQGYSWYDKKRGEYPATLSNKNLPDHIKEADNSLVQEIISCSNGENCHGTGVFRIVPKELEFYKERNLALPRLCPSCRHAERIAQLNPMKLWERQCMCNREKDVAETYINQTKHHHGSDRCPNTFQTTYAPDREEIIYCKECYQKEVE